MRRAVTVIVLGLSTACGGGERTAAESEGMDRSRIGRERPPEIPLLPDYSVGTVGRLHAKGWGEQGFEAAWEAEAGLCEEPALLEVSAVGRAAGALLLLLLPPGDRVGSYPVARADTTVEPPTARVGIWLSQDRSDLSLRGIDGEVEIAVLGEHVTGRFTAILQAVPSGVITAYTGVFDRVPVEQLPADYCEKVQPALDPEAEG